MTQFYVPAAPVEDDDLDSVLQMLVVGITGLTGSLVMPRWQPVVPKQPEPGTDWCAIGVVSSKADTFPYVEHLSGVSITDQSGDLAIRHEELEVLVTFYGPHAKGKLGVLRDGLGISQNLESAQASGLYFISMEPGRAAPEFINQQWVRRWDSTLAFRRMVARTYAVNNIVSAEIDLIDDTGHVDRVINVPPDGR